jgi:hypothetical protein
MKGVIFLGKIDLILVGVGMDVGLDTINGGDFCWSFYYHQTFHSHWSQFHSHS